MGCSSSAAVAAVEPRQRKAVAAAPSEASRSAPTDISKGQAVSFASGTVHLAPCENPTRWRPAKDAESWSCSGSTRCPSPASTPSSSLASASVAGAADDEEKASAAGSSSASSSSSPGQVLVCDKVGRVQDHYRMAAKLGAGGIGSVRRAVHRDTGKACAVKCMYTEAVYECGLQREAEILASVSHPNVCRLIEGYEDIERTYIVMELCEGGDLLDKLMELRTFSEMQAAVVMRQLFSALSYMHERMVCHRDLKPENLMLLNKGPVEGNTIKIVDFGIACIVQSGESIDQIVGTTQYMAPEVIRRSYDQRCDLWSAGCILYLLLRGSLPFNGEDSADVMQKVLKGKVRMTSKKWETISKDAKRLVASLLQQSPDARLSPELALDAAWLRRLAPAPAPGAEVELMEVDISTEVRPAEASEGTLPPRPASRGAWLEQPPAGGLRETAQHTAFGRKGVELRAAAAAEEPRPAVLLEMAASEATAPTTPPSPSRQQRRRPRRMSLRRPVALRDTVACSAEEALVLPFVAQQSDFAASGPEILELRPCSREAPMILLASLGDEAPLPGLVH